MSRKPKDEAAKWPSIEYLVERRNTGATLQDLGDEIGVTRERVRQVLVKNGVERPPSKYLAAVEQMRKRKWRIADMLKRDPTLTRITLAKWMRKLDYAPPPKPLTHGRTGYNRGCRCDVCRQANRHQVHVWYRENPKARRFKSREWRSDKEPCTACEAEGWVEPVKTIEKRCPYCGGTHTQEIIR